MNIQSIVLLALILLLFAVVAVRLYKNRGKCDCSSCSGSCLECKKCSEKTAYENTNN